MDKPALKITFHAGVRCAQRGISERKVLLVIKYGRKSYCHGARVCYLRKRDANRLAEQCIISRQEADKLSNITVILNLNQQSVITAYHKK